MPETSNDDGGGGTTSSEKQQPPEIIHVGQPAIKQLYMDDDFATVHHITRPILLEEEAETEEVVEVAAESLADGDGGNKEEEGVVVDGNNYADSKAYGGEAADPSESLP